MPLLEVEGLTKRFNGFVAVNEVDLTVDKGEIHSIIGPNGAGKTTFFNLLTAAYEVTAGTIRFNGSEITQTEAYERPSIGIARSYQITNIYQDMTVSENIQTAVSVFHTNYYDMLRPLKSKTEVSDRTDEILRKLDLIEQKDVLGSSLSHGNKRRLEIGMTLASEPELLLLDEPTAGMDATETKSTMNLVEDISKDKGVLLVEHDIELVMDISDVVTVLERGEAIARGTPDEIKKNQKVQEAYLGGKYA